MNIRNNPYLDLVRPEYISKRSAENIRTELEQCANGVKQVDISSYSTDEHLEAIRALEILENMHRNMILDNTKEYNRVLNRYEDIAELCPVNVTLSKNRLRVFVPLTIKRKNSRSRRLGAFVRYCLEEYQTENSVNLQKVFQTPVAVFCIRHVHKYTHAIFDNDNNEDGPIVNEIFQFLGRTDNPNNMRLYANGVSIVPEEQPKGVEFIVCPLSDAKNVISEELQWTL